MPAPQSREGVEFCATPELARLPLSGNPALLLQFMERRIERAIANLQHIARDLLQALTDGPAMQRLQSQDLEKQKVQRALHQIRRLAHTPYPRLPRAILNLKGLDKQGVSRQNIGAW